jgi:DNA-binding MarR family transcriptional regulator
MEMDIDQESVFRIANEIDVGSFSPELRMFTSSSHFHFIQAVYKWQRCFREHFIVSGLTCTQFIFLTSLAMLTHNGKLVTQKDLANFMKTNKMMASDALKTLEQKEYIIRENHPTDRRAKSLIVTKKGFDFIEVGVKLSNQFNEQFFSPLGDEKTEFIRLLKKLL